MAYISWVTAGGSSSVPVGSSLAGYCATAAGTAAKVATVSGFDYLAVGVTVHIRFDNTNTASNPTLKVGSTAAAPLLRRGNATDGASYVGTTEASSWKAGSMLSLTYADIYDGTSLEPSYAWVINDFTPVLDSMTAAEASAGTGTAARGISPKVLADYVASKMTDVAGALVYKGTVSAQSALLGTALSKGWYYIVDTAGTYGTAVCEPGDMIIVEKAGTYTTASALAAAVDVIQTNIDTITNAEIDAIVAS